MEIHTIITDNIQNNNRRYLSARWSPPLYTPPTILTTPPSNTTSKITKSPRPKSSFEDKQKIRPVAPSALSSRSRRISIPLHGESPGPSNGERTMTAVDERWQHAIPAPTNFHAFISCENQINNLTNSTRVANHAQINKVRPANVKHVSRQPWPKYQMLWEQQFIFKVSMRRLEHLERAHMNDWKFRTKTRAFVPSKTDLSPPFHKLYRNTGQHRPPFVHGMMLSQHAYPTRNLSRKSLPNKSYSPSILPWSSGFIPLNIISQSLWRTLKEVRTRDATRYKPVLLPTNTGTLQTFVTVHADWVDCWTAWGDGEYGSAVGTNGALKRASVTWKTIS